MAIVLRRWKEQEVGLNPPASSDALVRLASMFGHRLPRDLEEFYRSADGMQDNQIDGWHASFWSIERVMRERDVIQSGERHWWAFGDVLIDSWFIRICPDGAHTLVLAESTQEVFDSLQDFFKAYIDRPDSLGLFRA